MTRIIGAPAFAKETRKQAFERCMTWLHEVAPISPSLTESELDMLLEVDREACKDSMPGWLPRKPGPDQHYDPSQ
jgi:hypothetical protein